MLGAAGPAPSFFHSNQWSRVLLLKSGALGMKSLMAFLGFFFFPLLSFMKHRVFRTMEAVQEKY